MAAQSVGDFDLVWIASSTFTPVRDQAIPLVTLGPQCVFFRKRTTERLDMKKYGTALQP
jgi:hypothetical protein